MKKIKGLIVAFVAMFVFTLAMVTANAADVNFGLYSVTTTTNTNDTATWDYKGVTAQALPKGSVLTGGVIVDDTGRGSDATKGIVNALDVYSKYGVKGGTILVPVPAESAGTFTLFTLGDFDARQLALNNDTSKTVKSTTAGASLQFTASDIITSAGKTYLSLTGYNSDSTDSSKREVKIAKMVIKLSTGAYESSAAIRTVTIKDGQNVIKMQKLAEGSLLTKKPIKWGYDFEGFYNDADLTDKFDEKTTPISGDMELFANFTEWPAGTIANKNKLDMNLMAKGYATFGAGPVGEVVELTGQPFAILGGGTEFIEDAKTADGLGTTTHAIKTGGSLSAANPTNGLCVHVEAPTVLTIWARSGSGTARTIDALKVKNNTSDPEVKVSSAIAIDNSAPQKVTVEITEPGDYRVGSTAGSMVISEIEMTSVSVSVALHSERVAVEEVEHIRLVAKLENIADTSDLKLVLKSDALEGGQLDLTADVKRGTRVTKNGEAYSIDGVSFDVEDGVVYLKCVVEAGAKYATATFTAEITVGGQTKTITINALA